MMNMNISRPYGSSVSVSWNDIRSDPSQRYILEGQQADFSYVPVVRSESPSISLDDRRLGGFIGLRAILICTDGGREIPCKCAGCATLVSDAS